MQKYARYRTCNCTVTYLFSDRSRRTSVRCLDLLSKMSYRGVWMRRLEEVATHEAQAIGRRQQATCTTLIRILRRLALYHCPMKSIDLQRRFYLAMRCKSPMGCCDTIVTPSLLGQNQVCLASVMCRVYGLLTNGARGRPRAEQQLSGNVKDSGYCSKVYSVSGGGSKLPENARATSGVS